MSESETEIISIPTTEFGVELEVSKIKQSKSLDTIFQQAANYKLTVGKIKVNSDEEERLAVESIAAIATTIKDSEALRLSIITYPKKFTTMVDGIFKKVKDELGGYRSQVESVLLRYQNKKRIEQQKAQDRMQKEVDRQRGRLDKLGLDSSVIPEKAPQVVDPPTVRTESATSYVQKSWTFEVTDKLALIKAVAEGKEKPEALEVNEQYIKALIRAGVRELAGVLIYEKNTMAIRTK